MKHAFLPACLAALFAAVSASAAPGILPDGVEVDQESDALNGAQITVAITVSGENLLEPDNVVPFEIDDVFGKDIPMDGKLELMLG